MIQLFCIFLAGASAAHGDDSVALPPIEIRASATDALLESTLSPQLEGELPEDSPSGAIDRNLLDRSSLPIIESGQPGTLSQFRGFGKSSDETNVQTLGVPLNPVQGGGFDLSSFPQFIWSSFRFQLGPSAGAFDPRAVSGTLTLIPWTAEVLDRRETRIFRGSATGASNLGQIAAGGRYEAGALLAGYTTGTAKGPSGSASFRLLQGEHSFLSLHFLGTNLETESPGSATYPSPHARQTTARVLPLVQGQFQFAPHRIWRATLFFDQSRLKYADPDFGFNSSDLSRQLGLEQSLEIEGWQAGLSLRRTNYEGLSFPSYYESATQVSLSKPWQLDSVLITPAFLLTGQSGTGLLPAGSLGARFRTATAGDFFIRESYARRFPSLVERYYRLPGFQGNPDLDPESVWSQQIGHELAGQSARISSTLSFDQRYHAIVPTELPDFSFSSTVSNLGRARILSILESLFLDPLPWLTLDLSLTFNSSALESRNDASLPYLPKLLGSIGVLASWGPSGQEWRARVDLRSQTEANANFSGGTVPGFALVSTQLERQLGPAYGAYVRVENLFDRRVQIIQDYPLPGRVLGIGLSAEL